MINISVETKPDSNNAVFTAFNCTTLIDKKEAIELSKHLAILSKKLKSFSQQPMYISTDPVHPFLDDEKFYR